MKTKKQKRSSYLTVGYLEIKKKPIIIMGYDRDEKFVCRLEINAAGLSLHAGTKGNKKVEDFSWERLVRKLSRKT